MNAIINLLKQQVIGSYVFAVQAIFFYFILVVYLPLGLIAYIISLYIGAFVAYRTYILSKSSISSLTFSPTGSAKARFDKLIKSCGLKISNFVVRYSYTNEGIASATFNTVCVDPLIWRGLEPDDQFNQALNVINTHVVPKLTGLQITTFNNLKLMLTEDAQNFIFRHELAHVVNNYSIKKIVVNFLIAFSAAFVGLNLAFLLLDYGVFGVSVGFIAFAILDIIFTYISNATFKLYEEFTADKFAVKYSSVEEICAAADFFKNLQTIRDNNFASAGFIAKLPTALLSGHMNGFKRHDFLRSLAEKKQV